jgi:hypothetical protein
MSRAGWAFTSTAGPSLIAEHQVAELDRKIKAQVQALEKGIEPGLVAERFATRREALETARYAIEAICLQ